MALKNLFNIWWFYSSSSSDTFISSESIHEEQLTPYCPMEKVYLIKYKCSSGLMKYVKVRAKIETPHKINVSMFCKYWIGKPLSIKWMFEHLWQMHQKNKREYEKKDFVHTCVQFFVITSYNILDEYNSVFGKFENFQYFIAWQLPKSNPSKRFTPIFSWFSKFLILALT